MVIPFYCEDYPEIWPDDEDDASVDARDVENAESSERDNVDDAPRSIAERTNRSTSDVAQR